MLLVQEPVVTSAHPLIDIIAIGLVLAFLLGLVAHRLRISPIVGYLIAGLIIGPYTPGFVADNHVARQLSEIGVILLMFGVGLHFSFKDLLAVKSIALPGAIVQLIFATFLGIGLSALMGWHLASGIVFGLCLSTASTVVLLRALEQRQLIETKRGQIAIGWLIVEDIAMVLTLVVLPAVIPIVHQGTGNLSLLIINLGLTLGKVTLFIIVMLTLGPKIIPWLLAKSAGTGSRELFTLCVLAIAMGIAFGSVVLFQVSFALGAFFAGMVLNESDLSHRAAHDTLPLRDAFAVLFFVSVGMLFNPKIIVTSPFGLLATLSIIIFGKSLAAYIIVRLMRYSKRTALLISVSLAQIGEFAFILAALGGSLNVLNEETQSLIVAGAIFSILLNPLVFKLSERYLDHTETIEEQTIEEAIEEEIQVPMTTCNHAILIGYDRVGSLLGATLHNEGIPLVVIENSRSRVEELRSQGINTVLGNAANHDILTLARLDCARWLLVTTPNGYESGEIISFARSQRPDLIIIARAHYDDEAHYITEHGANKVVMGEKEIASCMLNSLQITNVTKAVNKSECPI